MSPNNTMMMDKTMANTGRFTLREAMSMLFRD
jgi:hypothetical protein